jgi:Holliday junction resolvase RusA-like endonuclease
MTSLCFTVLGEPMVKGNKQAQVLMRHGQPVFKNGRPITYMYEANSAERKRNAEGIGMVALAARNEAGLSMLRDCAVAVTLRFYTARPQGHYGTGRNAGVLKDRAPARPAKRPDVDKWVRHTLDALTGVVYVDDGQIVQLLAEKRYADGDESPRTEIEVAPLDEQTVGMVVADEQLAIAA